MEREFKITKLPKLLRDKWVMPEGDIQGTIKQDTIAGVLIYIIEGLDFECWFPADDTLDKLQDFQIVYMVLIKIIQTYPSGKTTLIELKSKIESTIE